MALIQIKNRSDSHAERIDRILNATMAATLFVFTLTIGLNAVIVFSDPKHVPISYAELKTDVSTRYAELQKLDSRI